MEDRLILQIILGLIGFIVALVAFIWNGHVKQHHEINAILKEMVHTKETCMGIFALKKDLAEMGGRLAVLEKIKVGN